MPYLLRNGSAKKVFWSLVTINFADCASTGQKTRQLDKLRQTPVVWQDVEKMYTSAQWPRIVRQTSLKEVRQPTVKKHTDDQTNKIWFKNVTICDHDSSQWLL